MSHLDCSYKSLPAVYTCIWIDKFDCTLFVSVLRLHFSPLQVFFILHVFSWKGLVMTCITSRYNVISFLFLINFYLTFEIVIRVGLNTFVDIQFPIFGSLFYFLLLLRVSSISPLKIFIGIISGEKCKNFQ